MKRRARMLSSASHADDIAWLLRLATRTAVAAGRVLRSGGGRQVVAATAHDLKISADRTIHQLILVSLKESRIPVLSEEDAYERPLGTGDEWCWVIDPIDGSVNYSRGIPLSCVSIALMRGAKPVIGVIHDFWRRDTYAGSAKAGATLNGKPIRVAHLATRAADSVLCTGVPAAASFSGAALRRLATDLGRYRKVRILGSAALSLAWVACGRADAYSEDAIAIWDVAAGLALVKAAGGSTLWWPAGPVNRVHVRAASRRLIDDVARHRPRRDRRGLVPTRT